MNCKVYIATKMTGRDRLEMVTRAKFVCGILKEYGLDPISPILEESVKPEEGKLVNHDKEKLHGFWKRDKEIIIKEAHVVLIDHGEMKSFGIEREYCLSRGVLWKPTCMLVPNHTPLSVAQFEDDRIFYSLHDAAQTIGRMWGTGHRRRIWRIQMLIRTLPKWLYRQALQWR